MLVAYAYVTSTSKVILIVFVYSLCVFSYYYFNVIQSAIDEFFKYFNFNEKFNTNINSSQVPIPYVNPVESASYHNIKYPSLRQMSNYRFDKSTLRHLSKVPRMNSAPAVRIAPPEPISFNCVNDQYISNNDRYTSEDINKNDKYLQVLREISRKRNYQEEVDRIDSTPKKSRRNMTSHSKRSHDDSSYDNLDTSRKKRCSDSDRSVAKILSYTSSLMHVVAPNLTWNNISKKRKSSKIEKSKNESPEKVEKVRKINHDEITEDIENYRDEQIANNCTYVKQQVVPVEVHENFESPITNGDECDSRSLYEPPIPDDDDGEYVKVASGKILNRTNCMYRKKLNSNRIDPQSVITLEPELVNGNFNDDDETMKQNLVRNLIDDIERKGEKDESVIFYEKSIVEEIANNQNKIEPAKPEVIPSNPTSFNPLLPQPTPVADSEKKLTFGGSLTPGPSTQSSLIPKQLELPAGITFGNTALNTPPKPDSNPKPDSSAVFNSSVLNQSAFNVNPVGSSTFNSSPNSNSLVFGSSNVQGGVDTVDSTPKSDPLKPEEKKEAAVTTQASIASNPISFTSQASSNSNPILFTSQTSSNPNPISFTSQASNNTNPISFTSPAVTSVETSTVASSPKGGFLFPCVTSTAPSNMMANSTSIVNSASFNISVPSSQQNASTNSVNTTSSVTPVMSFGTAASSPFSLGANNNMATKTDSTSSATPQFIGFGASSNAVQPAENAQKNPLAGITMFGNTPIATTPKSTSTSNAAFTSANSVPSFTNTTPSSGGFQFGQSATPSSGASTGFSFGASTNTPNDGFKSAAATTAPPAFGATTPAFGTATTASFNTSSTLSFASSTPPAFGAGTGLKFDAKPAQSTPSFSNPIFNATTTASSFAAPSVPSFGTLQTSTFGGGFGTSSTPSQGNPTIGNTATPSQGNPTFGNTATPSQGTSTFGNTANSQPTAFGTSSMPALSFGNTSNQSQTNSSFGNATTQSISTFGTSQPPAFGNTQNTTFGSGDQSSLFSQNKPAFGSTTSSQFGSGTGFTFGASSANTQPPPTAFGTTPASSTPFGNAGAAQPSTFNATPSFNFSTANSSSFSSGNVFGATAPKPAENAFAFGSSNVASAPAPFTFGTAPQAAPQSQPFTFAGAGSGTASAGGFSIGAGGSSRTRTSRNRRKT